MYAWSRIAKTINEWGRVEEWVEPGDEVSQSDIGVNDDDWQELQDSGAVREEEYPPVGVDQSPAEYYRENPEEAPTIAVDENTPEPEAMAAIETGLASGMKMPTEEGTPAAPATQEEQTAPPAATGGGNGGNK